MPSYLTWKCLYHDQYHQGPYHHRWISVHSLSGMVETEDLSLMIACVSVSATVHWSLCQAVFFSIPSGHKKLSQLIRCLLHPWGTVCPSIKMISFILCQDKQKSKGTLKLWKDYNCRSKKAWHLCINLLITEW